MNTQLLNLVEKNHLRDDIPEIHVGDSVKVYNKIIEGEKQRIQLFEGIVIALKGSSIRKTICVRKISNGVGVERIFPVHSPMISKIELVKKGKVRRSKIFYMRKRVGKSAMYIKGKVSQDKRSAEQ